MRILWILLLPVQIFCKGRLIEVCGIDGSGKTTFIQDLREMLQSEGRKVVVLKPLAGDPSMCKVLNDLVSTNLEVADRIERFKSDYFFLSFLIKKGQIEQHLAENIDVICDRYMLSFRTYQKCFGQSSEEGLLEEMPKADITFCLTIPVEKAIQRILTRGRPASYENAVFLERAQTIFFSELFKCIHLHGDDPRERNREKALMALK